MEEATTSEMNIDEDEMEEVLTVSTEEETLMKTVQL
jgi:hypothetical protein